MAFKLTYKPNPGQEFFSNLLSFTESALECPVEGFIALSTSFHTEGLSLHTNCPDLHVGRLRFTELFHTLYFPGRSASKNFCLPPKSDFGDGYSTYVYSYLQDNVDKLQLGSFLTLLPPDEKDSASLSLAFSSQTGNSVVGKLHNVKISVLGTEINNQFISIQDGNLLFSASANIYNNHDYSASLSGKAPTTTSWNRLPLTVNGSINGNIFEEAENDVRKYLEELYDMALRREQGSESCLQRSQSRLQQIENTYKGREQSLTLSAAAYEEAMDNVTAANMAVQNAQESLDSSSEEARSLETQLQSMCMEQECEDTCIPGIVNSTCYEDLYINETDRCNYTATREVVVSVEYLGPLAAQWERRNVCRWQYDCYCTPDDCYLNNMYVCAVLCVSFYAPEILYRNVTLTEQSIQERDCTVRRYTQTVANVCPMQADCARRGKDPTCISNNTKCRTARDTALEDSDNAIAKQFQSLNDARKNLEIALLREARLQARHQSDMQRLEAITEPLESAKKAFNICEENSISIKKELSRYSKLVRAFNSSKSAGGVDVFKLTGITFELTLIGRSPTVFPLQFSYEILKGDGSYQTGVTVATYDFTAPKSVSLRKVAEQIAEEAFLVTANRRRKRQEQGGGQEQPADQQDSEQTASEENRKTFEENCIDWNNMGQYFRDLFDSLDSVERRLKEAAELNVTMSPIDTSDLDSIDTSILENEFNVSSPTDSIMEKLRDSEEIKALNDLNSELQAISMDLIESATDEAAAFSEWQVRLDILHNQTGSIGGYPCFGLGDCIATAVEVITRILRDSPEEVSVHLLQKLASLETSIQEVANSENLTVSSALYRIKEVVNILEDQNISQYWCGERPTITQHPPLVVEVPMGGTLELTCEAESNLILSYQWKKDGNIIAGSDSNSLVVTGVQREDSGNYSCVARNPVGSEESIQSRVTVYETPTFYLEPESTTKYAGDENGAWFGCNATSWPFPGWKWFFRMSDSDQWQEIQGEETNELRIIKPQAEHQGWYRCLAYTKHGNITSEPAFLQVLPISIVQLGIPVQLILSPVDSDGVCAEMELKESFSQSLMKSVNLKTTSIYELAVQVVDENNFEITFTILSKNLTNSKSSETSLSQIIQEAIPTRSDVLGVKKELQDGIETISVTCGGTEFLVSPGSLTFFTPIYVCPEGQQLDSTFFLCGEYSTWPGMKCI